MISCLAYPARVIKPESAGIKGEVLQWIISFLTNRRHRVSVEGKLSNWAYVKSGVPQGSVLGPTLFVISINDMPNLVRCSCKHCADNAKFYTSIKTNAGTSSLHGDINSLALWPHIWDLPFNEEKCKSTRIGKESTAQTYQMNGHELEQLEVEKDLDVIIDKKLKFHTHTSAVIKKARRILGLIKRYFSALDQTLLPILFTSMVRPHLEYGNSIWGPHESH